MAAEVVGGAEVGVLAAAALEAEDARAPAEVVHIPQGQRKHPHVTHLVTQRVEQRAN